MSETISVRLGTRSYQVHVGHGIAADSGTMLKPFARGVVPVVTDTCVASSHLDRFRDCLQRSGIETKSIILDPGERTKSFEGLEKLTDALLETGVDRDSLIVALGGGVIGDLTGFAAGILKRGVGFAQVPTSLLAQVDSSVGGKTAINARRGKNLIGLFHQPRIVIADTDFLKTLPKRELRAGYAEVLKYGAIGDAHFFEWLEGNGARALAGDDKAMVHAVSHSCRMKAEIVSRDEREAGERALLNFGHTIGHALEAATGYSDRPLHGEAVAIGMALELRLSVALGLCSGQDSDRLIRHLKSVGLPTSIDQISGPRPDIAVLLEHMSHDKKIKDGRKNFVLVRAIGQAFVSNDIPEDALEEILR
jgi:3-dehydroquinate synthase